MVTNGGLEEMSLTDEDEEHEDSNNEADGNKIVSGSPKTNDRLLKEKSLKIRFQGQFERDWTLPTPFDVFLSKQKPNPVTYLKELCEHVIVHRSLGYILEKIPKTGPWVHDAIPQFREKEGQKCLLVLGFLPTISRGQLETKGCPSISGKSDFVWGRLYNCDTKALSHDNIPFLTKRMSVGRAYQGCLELSHREAPYLFWATRLETLIAEEIFKIQFEACAAFSSGSHDIAKNLGMKVFEIKDPGHIGRDKRSPWVSRITMEAISQEISEIDGRSPESVYELLRTVFHTARPGWNLPEWGQEAPISFRRIARLKAIEKSLDDTTKKTKYEGGVESEPATEPWQLAFQRCEESRKKHNEHVRAIYNGLDIDARNSKIEWQKDYRRRHGEERNRKRRENRAKERDAAGVKKEKGKPRGSYSKSAKDFRELKATQEQQLMSRKQSHIARYLMSRRPASKASEHGCSDYPYRAPASPA